MLDDPWLLHNARVMETIVVGQSLDFLVDITTRLLCAPIVRDEPAPTEQRLIWNSGVARGHASSIRVRDGIELMLTDVRGSVPFSFDMLHQPRGLELCFSRRSAVRVSTLRGDDLSMQGNFCVSQVKEPTHFHCEADSNSGERSVSLQLAPDGLLDALGIDDLPPMFAEVLRDTQAFSHAAYPMTPRMFEIVDELASCDLVGPMRRLYFESKALELVVLATEAATSQALGSDTLTPSEVERLEHAKTLLHQGLASPPSLRSLARACGLNERKLKEGFKARFGTTVFGYVRAQRMSHAYEMLTSADRSVTEVASMVGYANPSKFAAAFRREFGVAPSAVA